MLDAGCGEGWLLRRLQEAGVPELAGFDASQPLIEAISGVLGATLHVATYDGVASGAVSFGEPFDAIICNFAILEEDITGYLRALAGMLRPEGALYIQTLAPGANETAEQWRTETFQSMDGTWHPMPYFFRTLEGWRRAFEQSGLQMVSLREPGDPDSGRKLSLLFELQAKTR